MEQKPEGRAEIEAAVREKALENLCVLTSGELFELGLSFGQLRRRVDSGRYTRLHQGVFLVDSLLPPPGARELAAVRFAGERVAVGGASAAMLDGWPLPDSLRERAEARVELVTTTKRKTQTAGIKIRQVSRLFAADVREIGPIPVTTTARTVIDLLPDLDRRSTERLISELYVGPQKLKRADLVTQIARSPRVRGIPMLRELIEDGVEITDSVAEELLRDAASEAGLPMPVSGRRVCGYKVDALWSEHRVVAEVDGFGSHGQRRRTFERDHAKTQDLQLAGYFLFAVTYDQLTKGRVRSLAKLARILEQRKPAVHSA